MGDSECERSILIYEVVPACIEVITITHLHIAIGSAIVLKLCTSGDGVNTGSVGYVVGNSNRLNITEVTIGKRIKTDSGVNSLGIGAIYVNILENIDGREDVATETTGLILM